MYACTVNKVERFSEATKIANKLSGTVWLTVRSLSHTQHTSSLNYLTQPYILTDLTARLNDLKYILAIITQPCFLTYWKLVQWQQQEEK